MRKPIAINSNDWHIDESNLGEIPGLISQKIKLAKEKGVKTLICTGDIFQSRKAQKESVLNCFKSILDDIYTNNMILYAIPGNHDKTDYKSFSSFLDPFDTHPALKLMTTTTKVTISNVECYFIPFFEEQIWLQEFKKIPVKYDILFSHIAVNGSVNNNHTKVESSITPGLFKDVEVFLGHYHNYQDVAVNIHHLPSLKQNNFGENDLKGFTVIYDDCSFEIVKSDFKKYVTYNVNVRDINFKKLMQQYSEETFNSYIKVKLTGPKSEIKSIDLDSYKFAGIKIDTIFDELVSKDIVHIDLSNKETILEHFQLFCQERDINYEEGLQYLKKTING